MQMLLAQFGVVAAGGLVAIGKRQNDMLEMQEYPEPVEIDLSGNVGREEPEGILYNAAEFLIISISGCGPKR